MPFLKNVISIKPSYGVLRLSRKPICVAMFEFEFSVDRVGPGNLGSTDAGPGNLCSTRATGVNAAADHRIANFISVGFTYKHADGNLTRIAGQLSVPAPFENKSESMTHEQKKFAGLWCVVRQAQMQS